MQRIFAILLIAASMAACTKIDDKRTPAYMVNIRLNSAALWSTYGVSGMGSDCRTFIRAKQIPKNFPYTANTYTGFGGVLLIMGYDFTTQSYGVPVAYEMSCPVETRNDVVVSYDTKTFEAYCPKCGSRYNVMEGGGAGCSGPALEKKFGLTRYHVYADNGGYTITN